MKLNGIKKILIRKTETSKNFREKPKRIFFKILWVGGWLSGSMG